MKEPVSAEALRELLRLDPETGRLFWRARSPKWFTSKTQTAEHNCARWNARFAGKEALTSISAWGYRVGTLLGINCAAHRVVFAVTHGRWPPGDLDHRDGDRLNNRPGNLREATRRQNNQNCGSKGGTSAFRGVCWLRADNRWLAQATDARGRHRYLGQFEREEDAARAHDAFVTQEHGVFARPNFPDNRV